MIGPDSEAQHTLGGRLRLLGHTPPVPAPSGPRPARAQLERLTSLRFFAAVMVVIHHCTLGPTPLPIVTPLAKLGYVGVTFFFVLSGFVLAWSGAPELPARYFYGRRFARIYPTHGVTLLAALALCAAAGLTTGVGPLLTSVFLTQAWVPISAYTEQLNNVSWSLADEAFFYAIFPFVFLRWSRLSPGLLARRIVLVLTSSIAAAVVVRALLGPETAGNLLYKFPAFRVGEFLIGVALGLLVKSGWRSPVGPKVAGALAATAYLTLAGVLALLGRSDVIRVIPDLLLLAPFALLIASAASADIDPVERRRGLTHPAMTLLGRASFQLYMTHFLVLLGLTQVLPELSYRGQSLFLVGFVLLSILISLGTYHAFELPVERWLRSRIGRPAPDVGSHGAQR